MPRLRPSAKGQAVSPLAAPEAVLPVRDLLGLRETEGERP